MYPKDYNPDGRCPFGCDFHCSHIDEIDDAEEWDRRIRGIPSRPVDTSYREESDYEYPMKKTKFSPSEDYSAWKGANGVKTALVDMTDLHLARALAKTIEKESVEHPRAKALLKELVRRSHGKPEPAPDPLQWAFSTLVGVEKIK